MPQEREIKQRVSCSNCTNLRHDEKCSILELSSHITFSRLVVETGSKPATSNPEIKRFCQHHESKYPFTVGD